MIVERRRKDFALSVVAEHGHSDFGNSRAYESHSAQNDTSRSLQATGLWAPHEALKIAQPLSATATTA